MYLEVHISKIIGDKGNNVSQRSAEGTGDGDGGVHHGECRKSEAPRRAYHNKME